MANEKRLIDFEQAKRATYEEIFWTESEQAVVRNFLAKLPKVDAVEVFRCKECKYCDRYKNWSGKEYWGCTWIPDEYHVVDADHFCSYGERKEDG
jgi:hypothetical protein